PPAWSGAGLPPGLDHCLLARRDRRQKFINVFQRRREPATDTDMTQSDAGPTDHGPSVNGFAGVPPAKAFAHYGRRVCEREVLLLGAQKGHTSPYPVRIV